MEFGRASERRGLYLSLGGVDRPVAEIQPEGRLGKEAAVVRLPRFTHNLAAPAGHGVDEPTVDVSPIDQHLFHGDAPPPHADRQAPHRFSLTSILTPPPPPPDP